MKSGLNSSLSDSRAYALSTLPGNWMGFLRLVSSLANPIGRIGEAKSVKRRRWKRAYWLLLPQRHVSFVDTG